MPTIQGSASVAASSVNENVLADSQFELLPFDAQVDIALVGDANAADLRCDVYSGQDILAENMQPSAQNRIPNQDDFTLQDVAAESERLKIRVRNTSAVGARTINFAVKLTPIV